MRDVYAMDFVSGWIVDVAEQGTPSESSGADEERIEKPDVEAHDGNASALYNEDYNYRLSQRRISSLENYFKNWNDGAMREYFQATDENGNPRIKIERLAIGKSESRSENPEILEEKRRSIYTKEAMDDRRIEIRVLDYK